MELPWRIACLGRTWLVDGPSTRTRFSARVCSTDAGSTSLLDERQHLSCLSGKGQSIAAPGCPCSGSKPRKDRPKTRHSELRRGRVSQPFRGLQPGHPLCPDGAVCGCCMQISARRVGYPYWTASAPIMRETLKRREYRPLRGPVVDCLHSRHRLPTPQTLAEFDSRQMEPV